MASQQSVPTAPASAPPSRPPSIAMPSQSPSPPVVTTETVIMPSGAAMTLCVPVSSRGSLSPMPVAEGCCSIENAKCENGPQDVSSIASISSFLARYNL